MCRHFFLAALVTVATHTALGQTPPGPPAPGPEHQRLQFFVGNWKYEGEIKESPFGPAGKLAAATQSCEWFEGGFHVICRSDMTGPEGNEKELEVLAYDRDRRTYTRYNIGSSGQSAFAIGRLDGNTWHWQGEGTIEAKTARFDLSWTETSADSLVFKADVTVDGRRTTLMQGTAKRMK
jgi:hypothetical protein